MIKRGILPEERKYRGRCFYCKSEYEAEMRELNCDSFDKGEPPAYYINCQVCNVRVYFKEMRMTQENIVRRIIEQDGCQDISCTGRCDSWNKGVECPFLEGKCTSHAIRTKARDWANKHGLSIPYSSTFTIEHRFKSGDRVQHKYDTAGLVATVAEVMLGADCGVFYRFTEDGVPTGSISYCDENMRLADCDDEAEKTKEMQ